ncbi:MAG: thiamine pyrophosphate-requiring protein [Xanthobacteraceae bacterium]|nr:thiamine pyrophosphate-requiring protein [Xanthobacteraceae bacterium]
MSNEDPSWVDVPTVRDVGEAVVSAMGLAGIEYIFFTSGSEICFYQEAIAKLTSEGRAAPKLITITHEHVGLNAALGYAAVSGRPAVTAVHVDAGTLHQGGAIHTAYRSGLPVLMTAGAPPTSYPGSIRGARGVGGHIWMQQVYDQHAIVRQYVKWDHRLEYQDNAGLMVGRALQLACSPPCGPVYLSLPQEISLRQIDGAKFPALKQLAIARPPAPDREGIRDIASRLIQAKNPFVVVSGSGRNPATVQALVRLCEMSGLPAVNSISRAFLSFPFSHPLFQGSASLDKADVVLVIDADIPWMPGPSAPGPDCYVAVIDIDPVKQKFPTFEFPANLRLTSDPLLAITALIEELQPLVTSDHKARFATRAAEWAKASERKIRALQSEAASRANARPIDPLWLSYQIAESLEEDDIVIDDTLPASRFHEFVRLSRPGSYITNPGTSGGWAPGAALGAKFAAPDRDVIAVSGDGFYMFGTPAPALWAAAHHKKPFLMVVYQNRSYTTATTRLNTAYPDAFAKRQDFDYQGGYFDPPIDFAREAEAAGAYGESVRDPGDIRAALKRGREQIRRGVPAVISVWLPRILKAD